MDRNHDDYLKLAKFEGSLSARRAWIEITQGWRISGRAFVALRKESVDRNGQCPVYIVMQRVALRKESVDRNSVLCCWFCCCLSSLSARRAWIEIWLFQRGKSIGVPSLSARRAWIEMRVIHLLTEYNTVALRKESVDRNTSHHSINSMTHVALRKESVDRNYYSMI